MKKHAYCWLLYVFPPPLQFCETCRVSTAERIRKETANIDQRVSRRHKYNTRFSFKQRSSFFNFGLSPISCVCHDSCEFSLELRHISPVIHSTHNPANFQSLACCFDLLSSSPSISSHLNIYCKDSSSSSSHCI